MVASSGDQSDHSLERCWWCGTPFPRRPRKIYCSRYCAWAVWNALNPGANRTHARAFKQRQPDRVREIARLSYEWSWEQRKLEAAAWAKANPELKAAERARRRAAKLGAGDPVDSGAWRAVVRAAAGICGYCGESAPLTLDHRIPLSRGGTNAIENLIPACGTCNSRKGTRTEPEFRTLLQAERERGISEEDTPYGAPDWAQTMSYITTR